MLSIPTNIDEWVCREDIDGTTTATFAYNDYVFCVGQLPGEDRSYHACIADKQWKKNRHHDMEELVQVQTDISSHKEMEDGIMALKSSIESFMSCNIANAAKIESSRSSDRKIVLSGLVGSLISCECKDTLLLIGSMATISRIICQ